MKHTVVTASDIAGHPTHRMDAEHWIDRKEREAPPDDPPSALFKPEHPDTTPR